MLEKSSDNSSGPDIQDISTTGSAQKQLHMIRQHTEEFKYCRPSDAEMEFEEQTGCSDNINDLYQDDDDDYDESNNLLGMTERKTHYLPHNRRYPRSQSPSQDGDNDCNIKDRCRTETNAESESQLSMRHLSEGGKAMRTTDPISSQFNMLNMYIGIALIALPKAVSEVGFIAAALGLVFINFISLGASYFLLKARNRFKRQRIIDFPDLANACYGPKMSLLCKYVLILTNTTFAMAQGMYLGGQADLFACNWNDQPE